MLSLFLEYPIVTGIAIVLALLLGSVAGDVDTRFGEILGMQMVFPLLAFGFVTILYTLLAIGKALLPGEVKKKKRARTLKNRNN